MVGKTYQVLVVDPIDEYAIELLKSQGFVVNISLFPSRQELIRLLKDHNVLVCRTNTKLNSSFFEQAAHLKCVALASTGYDQIDLETATSKNTSVIGLPSDNKNIDVRSHGNFISTAEHTVMLILAALGDFYNASASMKAGNWEKPKYVGLEAYQKTLGIIGFGRIGKLVASRMQAFGMRTIAFDPNVSREEMSEHNTEKVEFAELCRGSDVISIHAPKTPETTGLLNQEAFEQMRRGVTIVNVARSEIIEKDALLDALERDIVRRVAVDVFKNEPHEIEWDLVYHERVIPTPHIGGSTLEALKRISISTSESLINFLLHGDDANVINKKPKK